MPVVLIGTGVITPAPLTAARSGNNFVISWPGDAAGFIVQSTLNLFPPVTWVDVTNPPVLVGGQWTTTNVTTGPAKFYRLYKP